jgi:gliding motility-associated-like protein
MNQLFKISFLLLFSSTVFAQGVCNITTGIEKGGFTFDGPSTVCIGTEVKLKDNSGGTDVKYIFGYFGEDASKLAGLNPTTDTKWTFLASGQYTVLQYGKKNGKDMYFCDVVTVRKDNQPKFSYSSCNNDIIEINIPKDIDNNFDFYLVNWGNGASNIEKVLKSEIPFSKIKNVILPQTIKVEGFFNETNSNCSSASEISVAAVSPNGYLKPFHPNIEELELIDLGTAKLTISGALNAEGYDLFMTMQGSSFPKIPFKKNVKPGVTIINIPDKTKSFCFYVQRMGPCGIEVSAQTCTLPLFNVEAIGMTNELKWSVYPDPSFGIQGFGFLSGDIKKRQEIEKKENNLSLTNIQLGEDETGYLDKGIDCKKKYCYRIVQNLAGLLFYHYYEGKSISNEICIDRSKVEPPAITETQVSINTNNYSNIKFVDNSNWTLKKEKFYLFREEKGVFNKIDSINQPTTFIDKIDASLKSYCYKIAYLDECGSTSKTSPPFCTTNLSENTAGLLQWNNQSPFGNSLIKTFEIQSFDENTGVAATEATQSTNTYEPKLDKFEDEAKYRIKAIASDGKESFSNIYTIPVKVKLFLPNAFTPNGDGINDDLAMKGSFKRFTSFQIEIYNRWGIPVFTSNDVTNTWDGKYQNTIVPNDTYTYKIYAKLNDGQEFNKSGKFVLFR